MKKRDPKRLVVPVLTRIGVGHSADRVQMAVDGKVVWEIEPAKAREVARNLLSAADAADQFSDRGNDHDHVILGSHGLVESSQG